MKCPHCGQELVVSVSIPETVNVVERATTMLRNGLSGREIAAELGLQLDQLSYLMRKAGTPIMSLKAPQPPATRPGARDPGRTDDMISLHRQGRPYTEIARLYDLSAARVRQIVKANSE